MRAVLWSLRTLLPLAAAALLGGGAGCTTEAACFADCHGVNDVGKGGASGDTGISLGNQTSLAGIGGSFSIGGNQNRAGMGTLEDAGTPCDDVDTQTDVNNCGACGNVCIFTGAGASCLDGECVMGACNESRYDLDGDPDNGCEYACVPADDETEVCNNFDDDCDGIKDNGFDLTTDSDNCGLCGHKCELLNATTACEPGATTPSCVVTGCAPGFYDNDGVDINGCEYECTPTGKNGEDCAVSADPNCGKVEYCDGEDNDCNGEINDGNEASGGPEGGTSCYDFPYCNKNAKTCEGTCTAGTNTCVGQALVCIPGQGPVLETCDTLDNDCDGTKDNGFNFSTDPLHCGNCTTSCVDALPNAVAQCTDANGPLVAPPPACSVLACKPGYKDLTAAPGCEYKCPKFPTSAETCNGIDDDCDNVIDNPAAIATQMPAVAPYCNNGRPLAGTPCSNATVTCGGASGWVCNYPNATVEVDPVTKRTRVVEALCDGLDGNCDGQNDEAFLNKGQACASGQGKCSRTATYACKADKTATECTALAVPTDARDEACNGIDDNCDGQIDERNPTAGFTCYTAAGGVGAHACLGYIDAMVKVPNQNLWVYTFEASRPDATPGDPGFDNTRSCSKANVLPWTSVSQTEAKAVCESLPTSVVSTKMRLCSETEWESACVAGQAGTAWSYSTTPTVYDNLVCNDAATGNGTPWATSFNNGQSQRCRTSTQIWDMSGNVAEWTGSCITVLGKQYCRVRGGSFLSQGPATSCNFSFVLNVPTFANFDLGFRCCASAAP